MPRDTNKTEEAEVKVAWLWPVIFNMLGQFQLEVLRTIRELECEAYGMRIRGELQLRSNRTIHMAQVYAALSRLETLGLVASHLDDENSAGRRGRTRRVYEINAHGLQKLHDASYSRSSQGVGPKDPKAYAAKEKAATA